VCEHKFDVTFIEYVVTLAHTKKNLKTWTPIAFAQKDKSPGGTNENRWKWARSFQWRQNASITDKFHFGRTSQMLVAEGISWINRHFQTVFPGVVKK